MSFDFQFRSFEDDWVRDGDDFWFRVGHILSFHQTTDVFDLLIDQQLTNDTFPKTCLVELHRAITERPVINYFKEDDQDLDRVLDIFIRVNSAGTELSYSDLLMSIATAQWEHTDARETIHDLVDEINRDYGDFDFKRDYVLKAALMLADLDIRWRVENFHKKNMQMIEQQWPGIADALRVTVRLLASFGFTRYSLPSAYATLPITYYVYDRRHTGRFVESTAFVDERAAIRRWLCTVLLKRTFGGVADSVLRQMRRVIRNSTDHFPSQEIADAMKTTPRSLSFEPGQLETMLDERYGSAYVFALLALLFPTLDFRNRFHIDHIHPKSRFSKEQLIKHGIGESDWSSFQERCDRVPNLQLLEGTPNIEKSNKEFGAWLTATHPVKDDERAYRERHLIPDVNVEFANFLEFYDVRRRELLSRLRSAVGVVEQEGEIGNEAVDKEESDPARYHGDCIEIVGQQLKTILSRETQTLYRSRDDTMRVVCIVSKAYQRAADPRFWYAFRPTQEEFLLDCDDGFVAFGCGSADLTVLIPRDTFLPLLQGMRITEDENRFYWHVEIFGTAERLELGQSLKGKRIDITSFICRNG